MYLIDISPNSALVEGRVIRLANEPKLATNANVELNEDSTGLLIKKPGVYEVKLVLTVVSESNGVGVALRADGNELTTTEATFEDGEIGELVIDYPIEVKHDDDGTHKALVQFHATFDATLLGGHVIVERVI